MRTFNVLVKFILLSITAWFVYQISVINTIPQYTIVKNFYNQLNIPQSNYLTILGENAIYFRQKLSSIFVSFISYSYIIQSMPYMLYHCYIVVI